MARTFPCLWERDLTIDKMKKILLFILLTAICFLSVSCGQVDSSGLDEFESLIGGTEETPEQPDEPFAQMVYVVIPQNASAQLSAKATELAAAITEKTGVAATVKYDNESVVSSDGNLEVIVGNTNRLRSKEMLKDFRLGEYICCWDRGSIILGGRDEAATIAAIDNFLSAVLHGATATSLMGGDVKIEKRIEQDIKAITLNGYDLYDFTIVYSAQGESEEKEFAYALRDIIARKSGYLLDIMPYSSRKADTGKVICVGGDLLSNSDKQSHKALLSTNGTDVSIYGSGRYELSASFAEFADKILSVGKDGHVAAQINFHSLDNVDISSVNLCSAFFSGTRDADRITDLALKIRSEEYDVISFFKMSPTDASDVKMSRGEYEYYEVALGNDEVFVLLYRADSIKGVSSSVGKDLIAVDLDCGDAKYRFSYSTNGSALDGDGYRISVIDSKKTESDPTTVSGLDLVGGKAFDTQDYEKSFYMDLDLLTTEEIKCQKTEQSSWSTIFCSARVRAKYCETFIRLKNAS